MPTLRYLTAGESHGKGLVGILEGMPAGVVLSVEDLQSILRRRWSGFGRSPRGAFEPERIEIISGVRFGRTLGSPIALFLPNADHAAWQTILSASGRRPKSTPSLTVIAPGHADLPGAWKYDVDDLRDIRERASARETAMRTALSVPARNLLAACGITSIALTAELGGHPAKIPASATVARLAAAVARVGDSWLTPDRSIIPTWKALIEQARADRNTLGGCAEIRFEGLPIGLGSHVHHDRRLDARFAAVLMSIPAVRGVEIGAGIIQSRRSGREANDPFRGGKPFAGRRSNFAGGLEGGMTNGQPLVVRVYVKPPPSVAGIDSIDWASGERVKTIPERTDTAAVAAVAIIAESVVALELATALLETFGGDTLSDLQRNLEAAFHQRLKRRSSGAGLSARERPRRS